MSSGIYGIRCVENGKFYIGSAIDVPRRWSVHLCRLFAGKHHSCKLQNAWKKYGGNNFEFVWIKHCGVVDLLDQEQFFIEFHDSVQQGYNILPATGSARGSKRSQETKDRLSEKAKIRAADPEERRIRSERAKRQHAEKRLGFHVWKTGPDPEKISAGRLRRTRKEIQA